MPTVAPLDLDTHCLVAGWLGDAPIFALADGAVHMLDNGHHAIALHDGLLCAAIAPDGKALVTGGEDGKVCALNRARTAAVLGDEGSKWVQAVAAGPQGAVAWAVGRNGRIRLGDGAMRDFTDTRTIEGLAFAPKGLRVAAARYDGVSLHWASGAAKPVDLPWKGAHTAVTFSPDGRFAVSAMQENALHGWRLEDIKHMRMSGYPGKVKSWSWSAKGKWLATSGAPAAIVWPFSAKDGPMGKPPLELGARGDSFVTTVACHPAEDVVAIGYQDGMVLAVRFLDSKEVLLRRPQAQGGAITTMAWDKAGLRVAFGTQNGACGVIDITG